jgi:adenine-specific DNA-methyltransferase
MLFEEDTFFDSKFPRPQYLGAKYDLLPWIQQYIPTNTQVVLDGFSGSQSVAYFFKQLGKKVITNDFLLCNHQIGLGLIENNSVTLSENDMQVLFSTNSNHKNIIADTFTGIFFEVEDAIWLDAFRANCDIFEGYKKSLALAIMNRALQRKTIMGHFAHTKALEYARNPERVKRNASIAQPIKKLFLEQLPLYNQAIFDNHQENKSFNCNILDLLKSNTLDDVDLAYFDPPYVDSHSDYQSFYHFLETYTAYWDDKQFLNGTKKYFPAKWSGFDKKTEVLDSLHMLFSSAQRIPNWLISWNNRSFPQVEMFLEIVSLYKEVKVVEKTYHSSKGGKGSVKGSKEILFICTDLVKKFIFTDMSQNYSFSTWKKLFEQDKLEEFTTNRYGLLWLKLKSITRKEILSRFIELNKIIIISSGLQANFEEVFNFLSSRRIEESHLLIDFFIRTIDQEQRSAINQEYIVNELYKMKYFSWGGDYKNSLDRHLVDTYVKKYVNFESLSLQLEEGVKNAVNGYVLCSWYNHWSSILIENIFKSHASVLPTVGQVKKVDFFVNNIPFDLKVTYLPDNFVDTKRKKAHLGSEIASLKNISKKLKLYIEKDMRSEDLYDDLIEKIRDKNNQDGNNVLADIKNFRKSLVEEVKQNPRELIQNLYENQGELRFDSSNRLFLVLVDVEDFRNSWKLKRNIDKLKASIYTYLDCFNSSNLESLKINFSYGNKGDFSAYSDLLVID